MSLTKGKLYLIPTTMGEINPMEVLPESVRQHISKIDYYIVENEKTARKFIRKIVPEKPQNKLIIKCLNKFTVSIEFETFLTPCALGINVGILSEVGCPAIADPGSEIIKIAHRKNIQVVPLVGPSSILMAMMASGMNGQNFAFNGYLPINKDDRKRTIKTLEKKSKNFKQSQIFIETPYRNDKMLRDIITHCKPNTRVCLAIDISLSSEFIQTLTVNQWKHKKLDLHKRPMIFIIQA